MIAPWCRGIVSSHSTPRVIMIAPKYLFLLSVCFIGSLKISSAASQKIEVTAREYCAFLNRVPDAAALYEEKMAASILQVGIPGSYSYVLSSDEENKLITYVDQRSVFYYQTGYLPEEELPYFQSEIIDPFLKSNQRSLASIVETDPLTKAENKKWENRTFLSAVLGTLAAVGIFMNTETGRGMLGMTPHDGGGLRISNGEGDINTSSSGTTSGNNGPMQMLSASGDPLAPQLLETLSPAEQNVHDVRTGQSSVAQVLPTPKPVASDQVMAMKAGITGKGRTQGVSFDLPPEAEHTQASSSKRSEKSSALGSRKLKALTTDIDIAIESIPEDAPDKPARVAKIYAQAYSPIKMHLETLLTTLKGDASLQTKKNAIVLANTAITLMNAAFHAVNLETVTPIKIANNASDHIIAQKGLPFTEVSYTDIDSRDYNAVAIVLTGNDAMTNLQESLSTLRASDEDAGQALYNSQGNRAGRATLVASKKISALTRKRTMLRNTVPEPSDTLSQLELEIKKACTYSKECSVFETTCINAILLTDPIEARQCAIADILTIAEHVLQYVDKVRGMLTSRSTL